MLWKKYDCYFTDEENRCLERLWEEPAIGVSEVGRVEAVVGMGLLISILHSSQHCGSSLNEDMKGPGIPCSLWVLRLFLVQSEGQVAAGPSGGQEQAARVWWQPWELRGRMEG